MKVVVNVLAIREFNEETNLTSDDYFFIDNIVPIIENYIGSNKINYYVIHIILQN